ncbi:peroxin [Puccinia graminis f. sp. tritici]|uniref:Peroxin n=1 Tax=Puccinia graminis f. sp. tritici TaxID=56615 RepID=A0A5B0S599_PUCGR|nr:peroxin [Puccinia graminis f. sp. tritici]KAA1132293.1 peroxin [Puccinia graminis f. sp. tritici]
MTAIKLTELPPAVIKTIFELEPSLIHLFLVRLANRALHQLTRDIVYQSITIQDNNQQQQQLNSILNGPQSYSLAVRSIQFINQLTEEEQEQEQEQQETNNHPTNWDILIRLLSKLPNLKTFIWSSNRIPDQQLISLIGIHSTNLESFTLDIPNPNQLNDHHHQHSPPRPNNNGRQRSHTTGGWIEDSDSETELLTIRPIRWDAYPIEALPPTLTQLSISSLSVIGARNLSRAFHSLTWTALTDLTLSKSLFIDDELMASIAIGSKKIKRISIQGMSGTKLTERGIEQLFSGLDGLEEIELFDVEGRFSKVGWLKLDDLPPSLKSIKFGYHETGSYHSWTLDHLQNIVSLLALYPQKLEHFSVTRFVPLPTMLPGRHAIFPELSCNNRTTPQRISKEQILSIVAQGKSLKELNLDWWLISVEGLEVIVKGLPNLRKLTALVDAPFHRIITSTVFVHSKIQTLKVSIPPEHTPLVQELSQVPMTPTMTSAGSPIMTQQSGSCGVVSPGGTWGSQSSTSPIPTRDLKKFIKRAGHLKEIIWTGRGGLGAWKFVRNGPSALNVRVEFTPVAACLPPEAFAYQHSLPSSAPSSKSSHIRAGSSPRQFFGHPTSFVRNGTPIAHRTSRRTSSTVTTEDGSTTTTTYDGYSRRSSSTSLATSWASSSCAHLPPLPPPSSSSSSSCSAPSTGFHHQSILKHGILDDIPGTPPVALSDQVVGSNLVPPATDSPDLLLNDRLDHHPHYLLNHHHHHHELGLDLKDHPSSTPKHIALDNALNLDTLSLLPSSDTHQQIPSADLKSSSFKSSSSDSSESVKVLPLST